MEEDVGITVTRLKRRLSVESDDVKSSSTPSTPTKKRGGKLAAKPQLELINENATENVPKRTTRKSVAKDVKPLDEAPVTPSRRSARIRSNTSIISETTLSHDSPRAKRAARRNSQVGSDNEAPVTPARQTRKTRKDSTSSLEKQAGTISGDKIIQVAEVIAEEPETILKEVDNDNRSNNSSIRKSPRLKKKYDNKNVSKAEDESSDKQTQDDKMLNTSNSNDNSNPDKAIQDAESTALSPVNSMDNAPKNALSISTSNLLNELNTKSKEIKNILNKTDSALENSKYMKSKIHRTRSWETISVAPKNNNSFHSDNESSKKKNIQNDKFSHVNNLGLLNNINKEDKKREEILRQTYQKENFINDDSKDSISKLSPSKKSGDLNKSLIKNDICIVNKKENILHAKDDLGSIEMVALLEKVPSNNMQPLVFIEDSDSNTGSIGKPSIITHCDGEDQCVPVVDNPSQIAETSLKGLENNASYEPMDIDETIITENMTITNHTEKNNSINKEDKEPNLKQNLAFNTIETNKSASETSKKSDKKSSFSNNVSSQNLETSSKENKSTLILSQIKDVSSTEINKISKSPKDNEVLSQSVNIAKEKSDKKNVSVNYSTSTPLQQKPNRKLGMQINTSNIIPNTNNKTELNETKNVSKNEVSNVSKSSDYSDSSEEDDKSFNNQSNIIDDEAEEASDDYESGDSRDDDERQYEEENEIIDKGKTLSSEDDFTDDTDYEKDSFVVSSNEEDEDLLTGSGDDLSMSDNELTMSAKSKKKYNDRKSKEQKKASREMFKARHKLNDSSSSKFATDKPKKSKARRLDSILLESEDDGTAKKNNHHKIFDRDQGTSIDNSDDDEYIGRKKKKTKRLSESFCNDNVNEKEITIYDNSILETNDPLKMAIKLEPKTPQKDLNISTVLLANREEVEEMDIDENVSVVRSNETSDPLQATAQYENSSTSSDNLEIVENYDSLLNHLNSETGKKIKSLDTSLNLNMKTKQKTSEPVIDQLNLTETRKSKKAKRVSVEENTETRKSQISEKIEKTSKIIMNKNEDEESSDSIDMRLLFSEYSNDSETNGDKPEQENKDNHSPVGDFIPLKRSVAKTNIPSNNTDISASKDETLLNVSKKKTMKRKSSLSPPEENLSTDGQQENEVNFFIDTTGSLFSTEISNITLTSSVKKSKNKTNNIIDNKDLIVEGVPDEVECDSEKKKKNKKSCIFDNKDVDVEEIPAKIECLSENKKKKKKNNMSDSKDLQVEEVTAEIECQNEKRKKTKKNSMSDNKDLEVEQLSAEMECCSEKKKNSISDNKYLAVDEATIQIECHSEKKKKTKKNSISDNKDLDVEELPAEMEFHIEKKKITKEYSMSDSKDLKVEEVTTEIECQNEKKNKKNSFSHNKDLEVDEDQIQSECYREKKKKKSKHTPENNSEAQIEKIGKQQENDADVCFFIDTTGAQFDLDTSVNMKHNLSDNKVLNDEEAPAEVQYCSDKQKKKNKQDLDSAQNNFEIQGDTSDEAPTEMAYRSEKNKKKSELTVEEMPVEIVDHSGKKKKKSKKPSESFESNMIIQTDETDGKTEKIINTYTTTNSNEKKKKQLSQSLDAGIIEKKVNVEAVLNTSVDSAKMRKPKKSPEAHITDKPNKILNNQEDGITSKKRKRKSSADPSIEDIVEGVKVTDTPDSNIPLIPGRSNKKPKISRNNEKAISGFDTNNILDTKNNDEYTRIKKSRKNKTQENSQITKQETVEQNINKKRKERDDDNTGKKSKVPKGNSFDKIHVPRLPAFILNQLDDKPKKELLETKKSKTIATTQFLVEDCKKKKNKPSNYLEESIYLNDSPEVKRQKSAIIKPQVLPFIPTASTSENGYTSNFKINVLPQETQFIAQSSNVTHFKNEYLQVKRIKKLGTLERYKKHRNIKLSKF